MTRQIPRLTQFMIVLAVPIVILLLMTVKPLLALGTGEDISIQTKPVDPRDLLYGDYVHLSYEIEEVPADKIDDSLKKKAKDASYGYIKMYAVLKKQGDVHVLDYVTAKKPKSGVYLNGQIYAYEQWNDGIQGDYKYDASYNLDRYYIPENTGKSLEDKSEKGQLIAHLKVRNGYGILTDLKVQ